VPRRLADDERRVPVGEDLPRGAAQVVQEPRQERERQSIWWCRWRTGRPPSGCTPGQDQGVQLDEVLAERPRPQWAQSHWARRARTGLEPQRRIELVVLRSEVPHPAGERRIGPGVAEVADHAWERGGPGIGAQLEAPEHVGELGLAEPGRNGLGPYPGGTSAGA